MRADAGIITTASREIAYAAIYCYDNAQATGRQALELMRSIGEQSPASRRIRCR